MHQLVQMYHSKQLHHAYFVIGHKVEEVVSKLKHFFQNVVGVETSGNPDFHHGKYQTFTIEDARALSEGESRKSLTGGKKIFIIETDFITEEAQNSLLKVFEEPTPGTHFFIVSPQDILLPTLRSRMQVIFHDEERSDKTKSVLAMEIPERLTLVKELTEGISEAKSSKSSIARSDEDGFREEKTKQDAITLLNQIEKELHEKGVEKSHQSLKVCESTRAALYDRGAPIKMILENLMLGI